ncbi:MAG: T9SS type A sorting domain-containing protein, partial [Saprospiraceae bacterium]|nr:T9SS type A sorting domain-containing protein [Saprospiraceae bacterium]
LKTPYAGMPEAVEYRGYCGIRLSQYQDFNIGKNQTFLSLANGIVGYNSTGNINSMAFTDMHSTGAPSVYPFEGYGIYLESKGSHWFNINNDWATMQFDDCVTGIYARNYAGIVEEVDMENVENGIVWERTKNRDIVVKNNKISATKYGIKLHHNEPLHPSSLLENNNITITGLGAGNNPVTGILMTEGNFGTSFGAGWKVKNNTVDMTKGGNGIAYLDGLGGSIEGNMVNDLGQGSTPGKYKGITVEGSVLSRVNYNDVTRSTSAGGNASSVALYSQAGTSNEFICNCVDNTGLGMQFNDMADYEENVKGNQFNNHGETGLQIGDDNMDNAYIGIQTRTGNNWDLGAIPLSGYGGVHKAGSDLGIVSFSLFYVDPNDTDGDPDVDPDEWFEPLTGDTYVCQSPNTCEAPTTPPPFEGDHGVPTRLDEAIVRNQLPTNEYEEATQWKGQYRLYRKLLQHPAIVANDTLYANFKAAWDNETLGKLAVIAEAKAGLFTLTSVEDSILESRRLVWLEEAYDVSIKDSLNQSGISQDAVAYNTDVHQSNQTQALYDAYVTYLQTARLQTIDTLLEWNKAITPSETIEVNHQEVNRIVLTMLKTDSLSGSDITELEAIAGQCPLEGGDAVYEARAIVTYLLGTTYDDTELCNIQERFYPAPTVEAIAKPTAYPNPTSGLVIFKGYTGAFDVRVLDNLGRTVHFTQVTDNLLNLSSLQEGLYRIQVILPDGAIHTHTVVLINH